MTVGKQVLYSLDKAQADYRKLFEESPIPMFIYDNLTFRFLDVNAAASKYYGYSRNEFLKMTLHDIQPAIDTNTPNIVRLPSINSFYDSNRQTHVKKDGEVFYAQAYTHATYFGDRIACVMLAMDIHSKVLIEQKNAELNQIIRRQKQHLDSILSSVSDVVWSAKAIDFEITYVNQACLSVFGYTPQEMTGNSKLFFDIIHPDDIDRVQATWKELLTTGKATFEYRIKSKKGKLKYIINQVVLKKGRGISKPVLNGIAVDVTRLRTKIPTNKNSTRTMESVLENITDCFCAVDENWHFKYINKEFETLIRYSREYLIGKSIWKCLPELKKLKFYNNLQKASVEREIVQFEEFLPIFSKWFSINVYPADNGLDIYMRDITDEKKQHVKIQSRNERLQEIAWIQSHKVRGPVASILGLVDLFNHNDAADPINKEIITKMKEATKSLDRIIREIVSKTSTMNDY